MATASQAPVDTELQQLAQRHLWMHFSRMGGYDADHRDPDHRPRRGLLRLRRARQPLPRRPLRPLLRQRRPRPHASTAKRRRARSKSSTSTRSGATPTRGRSSWRRGSPTLAPGDLNRVFFTSGGSEAVESALKLARNFHRMHGKGQKHKTIAREVAYHGTSLGALSATGITELRSQFEPLAPGRLPRPEHQHLPLAGGPPPALGGGRDRGADRLRGARDGRRGDPRAGPERRRLLRPARRLLPAGARDLRPPRRADDLRRGDLRLGPARPLLRLRTLRLRAGHHHRRQGADLRLRADGRGDRLRPGRRAVHAGRRLLRPRLHLRRPPGRRGDRDGQPRRLRARGPLRPRARQGGRVPPDAREPARAADRRRRARRRLLPRDRAGQRQGDARRASTTRSPSGCCAASSPASSTSAA